MPPPEAGPARVGPVLESGELAQAIIAAIRTLNPQAEVADHGAYLRVSAPGRCVLTREAVERVLGRPFRMPGDLEGVMPSFKGRFRVSDTEAEWHFGGSSST
jgi:toluene monooxygenase system protein D